MSEAVECKILADIATVFGIDGLNEHQKSAVNAIRRQTDVFISTKTGSGKSLCYQSASLVLKDSGLIEYPVIIVVTALISIMKEQVELLNGLGISASYIGKDQISDNKIENGEITYVFSSPERILGDGKWRNIVKKLADEKRIGYLVIDEAHTVLQWGTAHDKEMQAFREWFGKLGELRSIAVNVPLMALTATANTSRRKKIKQKLCMNEHCVDIIDSPDRPNIKMSVKCINSAEPLSESFSWLIHGLNEQQTLYPRTLVFCKSIADTARLYSAISCVVLNRQLFNMYHSETLDHIKESIRENMKYSDGSIRVLVCTNAAGMGVNFAGVKEVVNYGPPMEMDTFVQQMGRAARDGTFAHHLLIYNKKQVRNVESEVLTLIRSDSECRRSIINDIYNVSVDREQIKPMQMCMCCDICAKTCDCGDCKKSLHLFDLCDDEDLELDVEINSHTYSDVEIRNLRRQLCNYKLSLVESVPSFVHSNIMHSFDVNQVIHKLSVISCPEDLMLKAGIFQFSVAQKVMEIIHEIQDEDSLFSDVSDTEYMDIDD